MSRPVRRAIFTLAFVLTPWTLLCASSGKGAAASSSPSEFRPVVERYCVSCHNERLKTGGLVLEPADLTNVSAHAEIWEKVVRKLRAGAMPPPGVRRPEVATLDAFASSLIAQLDNGEPEPGRPTLRRLNRTEYANAVRDLLGLDVDAALLLPPDDSSSGFDNNSDVLGVSPLLLEAYLSAARRVSALAVGDMDTGPGTVTYRSAPDSTQTGHIEGLPLGTRGGLLAHHTFPLDGEYVISVKLLETTLGAIRGLESSNTVEILVDGARVHTARVGGDEDFVASTINTTEVLKDVNARLLARVKVRAGERAVAADFLRKNSSEGGARLQAFLRADVDTTDHTGLPQVESISIAGPFNPTGLGDTSTRRRIFTCRPSTSLGAGLSDESKGRPTSAATEEPCARQILTRLIRRAYRRPGTDAEIERLMAFYREGRHTATFDVGIERALRSILASPKFVFRTEVDPPALREGDAYRVNDFELATRLSFFLWSSIPDDELLDVAARGQLKQRVVLEQQTMRMLRDPRAESLVANFADQWLQLRNLRASIPDQNEFPDFDDNLRQAFRRETELLFDSVMREDRSILDLLTADYTFVNERLAKHYGIPNIYGSHFRRVPVTDDARRGLLGKGSILMVTSHPDRTSPVLRGKWVLDNLLGTPPPPPPPNVPLLPEGAAARARTMREQMEAHRASPPCAGCHKLMDPIGFALENFDAVGAWRTRDAGAHIDSSGELTDGTRVDGAIALRNALLKRSGMFVDTFAGKMLTFAIGRGLDYRDEPAVRAIVRQAGATNNRFSALVIAIVESAPFQMRRKVNDALSASAHGG
jgi:mono/diheme cytochrome c family protein